MDPVELRRPPDRFLVQGRRSAFRGFARNFSARKPVGQNVGGGRLSENLCTGFLSGVG